MRVHVRKSKNRGNYCFRYSRIPQSKGEVLIDEMKKLDEIIFSFTPKMTSEDKKRVLELWGHKNIKIYEQYVDPGSVARIHVRKAFNEKSINHIKFCYGNIPQSKGDWSLEELNEIETFIISFTPKINDQEKELILNRWSSKIIQEVKL